jgi:serine protease Do
MTAGMLRRLLLVGFGLAAFCKADNLSVEQIADRATPSVVLIKVPAGLGSGFVAGSDGRIVTNYHVIRGAHSATVVTADHREFKDVEVMAADPSHDVVVLRIGARNLNALPLGDSSAARPGEHVVAIGHPLGLGDTVSDGLVSAVREISAGFRLLQISAPISPGSSGGPVLNDLGEVIGISTLVVNGGQNLNFAVPIDAVKPLLRADKGVPLASYQPPPQAGRNIPNHPLSLLNDCPDAQLRVLVDGIQKAITVGAPLYNQGNSEACYRIYAGTALDLQNNVQACDGPKKALLDGVGNADKATGWSGKAWAMRDAFDGVLAVAAKKLAAAPGTASAGSQRAIPHYSASVLDGCSSAAIDKLHQGIQQAINNGAPLFNNGNAEACYRIYEGAVRDFDRTTEGCLAAKDALNDGIADADGASGWSGKAWAMRDVFDGMINVIEQRGTQKQ